MLEADDVCNHDSQSRRLDLKSANVGETRGSGFALALAFE